MQDASNQEKKASGPMEKFKFNCAPYTEEVLIFFAKELDTFQLKSFEQDVFYRWFEMKLEKGFMNQMLEDEYFEQWIRLTVADFTWFDSILEMARTIDCQIKFENCCPAIMTEYLKLFLKAVQERKSKSDSYEFDVYQFLCSNRLVNITKHYLPAAQATVRHCCFMLALSLG